MRAFLKSFTYAAKGVCRAVAAERNLRFHLCVAAYVCVFSRFYSLTGGQYALLALVIGTVIALELVNTAIERIVDKLAPAPNPNAGFIKDVSAGAVLVASLAAVACGLFLFWDTAVFAAIGAWFWARPLVLALLALSLVFCVWFVFIFGRKKVDP